MRRKGNFQTALKPENFGDPAPVPGKAPEAAETPMDFLPSLV